MLSSGEGEKQNPAAAKKSHALGEAEPHSHIRGSPSHSRRLQEQYPRRQIDCHDERAEARSTLNKHSDACTKQQQARGICKAMAPDYPIWNRLPRVCEISGSEAKNTDARETDCKENMTQRDGTHFCNSPRAAKGYNEISISNRDPGACNSPG